jgi:hypothetical protein
MQFRFTPAAPVDSSSLSFLNVDFVKINESLLFSFFGLPSELNIGWVLCFVLFAQ